MTDPNAAPNRSSDARSVADRRHSDRESSSAHVSVQLDAQALQGLAENVSQAGVLLFSTQSLRVTVTIVENGVERTANGRVARVERMSAENSGYAIEFDVA